MDQEFRNQLVTHFHRKLTKPIRDRRHVCAKSFDYTPSRDPGSPAGISLLLTTGIIIRVRIPLVKISNDGQGHICIDKPWCLTHMNV